MTIKLQLIMLLILCSFMRAIPHEQESGQDTIIEKPELPLHKTILDKLIHRFILNSNITTIHYNHENQGTTSIPYHQIEGKIIRNIYINTLDPFGYSLQDTSMHPIQFTKKLGNTFHIQTRNEVIRNLLLIRSHTPFDSLLFKESERIIRSQKYIQEVLAFTSMNSSNADSLDIYIRVIDVWSVVPTFRKQGLNYIAGLSDNNFMGLGNRLYLDTRFGNDINGFVTQLGYTISNIGDTHITGNIQYYFSEGNDIVYNSAFKKPVYSTLTYNLPTMTLSNRYLVRSVELQRLFFSPLAKWAGGIFIGQLVTRQSYMDNDSIQYLSSKTNIQDYWGAWSLPLDKANTLAGRTTNIIISARFLNTRYPVTIPISKTNALFNNENFYFAGIGITSRRYIQDKYVFNYGKIEDIPIGRALGITTGYYVQKKNHFYLGLKAAWGNNYNFGYLSSHFEYGTFVGSGSFRQQVVSARINYYTKLFSAGYWKIRQFIKPSFIAGIHRLPTDNLVLSDAMEGLDELKTPATGMIVLSLQTQSYAPWEVYGFRFGPYFFTSLGLLSNSLDVKANDKFYSVLGLGVLIKNNYLLINTFQVSFSFYPHLPGQGTNLFNFNAYKTTDYGLSDFDISKPQIVDYR